MSVFSLHVLQQPFPIQYSPRRRKVTSNTSMLTFFPLYFQMAREDSKDGKYDHHLVLPLQLIGKKCQSRNMSFLCSRNERYASVHTVCVGRLLGWRACFLLSDLLRKSQTQVFLLLFFVKDTFPAQ